MEVPQRVVLEFIDKRLTDIKNHLNFIKYF